MRSVLKNLMFFHYNKGSRAQKVVIELLRSYQGAVQRMVMMPTQFMKTKKVFCCLAAGHMHAESSQKH